MSFDNLYFDICYSKWFLLICVVCRWLFWVCMDCDMLCCFFCIKFDCYYCFDNGFGSEYNEVNYFGFLSNVFYLSILFFCKILKM